MSRIFVPAGACFAAMLAVQAPIAACAQAPDYRPSTAAPASWQRFATLTTKSFEQWIGGEDDIARRFRDYLHKRAGHDDGFPESLIVRVWVAADGKIERVAFPSLNDPQGTEDLRTILLRGKLSEPPPFDMLQPLHLKLSLNLH
jgi:hypothetical protein